VTDDEARLLGVGPAGWAGEYEDEGRGADPTEVVELVDDPGIACPPVGYVVRISTSDGTGGPGAAQGHAAASDAAMIAVTGAGELVALGEHRPDLFGFRVVHHADGPAVEFHLPAWAAERHHAALGEALDGEGDHRPLGPVVELSAPAGPGGAPLAVRVGADGDGARLRVRSAPSDERSRETALLAQAEAVAQMGSWEFVPTTGAMQWSDNFFRVYGLEPGQVEPSVDEIMARTHPDDRAMVGAEIEAMREGRALQPMTHRIVLPGGGLRHLRVTLGVVEADEAGRPRRFVGAVQDLTDQRRAEHEIGAHIAVSEALAAWEGLEPGAERLLANLSDALECAGGVLWTPEDGHLVPRVLWRDPTHPLEAYWAATRDVELSRGSGLAGMAWERREAVHVVGAEFEARGNARARAARADGIDGAIAIPALDGDEVVAVVELPFHAEGQITERLLRSLQGIGHELGQFLGRRRGQLGASRLSARELEVLQLSARGLTTAAAAQALVVSPATVKTHLAHIYTKLGVPDRASAVATALRLGLIA
jgi:DNA-binding NarL/FixJ family response regulator/PAS domain-containing protein